jgi:hypothetical protein
MLVHTFMGVDGAVYMEWKGGSKATLPPFALRHKKKWVQGMIFAIALTRTIPKGVGS